MRVRPAVVMAVVSGAVVSGVVLSGCTDSSGEAAPAPTTGSTSAGTSSAREPADPEDTVTPASGPRLRFESGHFRLPGGAGFEKDPTSTLQLGEGSSAQIGARVSFVQFPASGTLDTRADLFLQKNNVYHARFSRRDDTELGWLPAFHVEGPGAGPTEGEYYVSIGASDEVNNYTLNVAFGLGRPVPPKAVRDEIVESVRASWTFSSRP